MKIDKNIKFCIYFFFGRPKAIHHQKNKIKNEKKIKIKDIWINLYVFLLRKKYKKNINIVIKQNKIIQGKNVPIINIPINRNTLDPPHHLNLFIYIFT